MGMEGEERRGLISLIVSLGLGRRKEKKKREENEAKGRERREDNRGGQ